MRVFLFFLASALLPCEAKRSGATGASVSIQAIVRSPPLPKAKVVSVNVRSAAAAPKKSLAQGHPHHAAEELMSAPTAVANVLADLCPHGMLPIGMLLQPKRRFAVSHEY